MTGAPDLAGKQIGRYRVVSLLGSGGMGAVYDAVDPALGRHVALKILPPDLVSDAGRLQRFMQEAKAASALNHAHLVSIYEVGSSGDDGRTVHFIAMEKIDGTTLRKMLDRDAPPLRKALELTAQVADAVAAAHAVGVIHRDLKPENIMVSAAGYAKVLDFGLAKLRPDPAAGLTEGNSTAVMSTGTGVILGTPGYMPPEQALGKETDSRSDIFSLGCILYELVTGTRAFRGRSSVDTLHKVIHDDPEPLTNRLPSAPVELQRIVRKAMAKDPDERYQSAKDLAVDVRALLRDLSATPAAVRPVRRWMPAIVTGLATIVILAGSAAVMVWHRTRSTPAAAAATAFRRITAKGTLVTVRVSPDGRFIAYAQDEPTGESFWLRQIDTGQDLQLVPAMPVGYGGSAFTPDGNAIVSLVESATEPAGALYRVSTIGGTPERLVSGAYSAPAFAPDGKRMAWLRAEFPHPGESALMVANSDGSGERTVAVRRYPELFAPIFFARPSWSPDGKTIAAAVERSVSPDSAKLIGFDPDNGRETSLTDSRWVSISAIEWLPDRSGIVAVGAPDAASIHAVTLTGNQIWFIPVPSGAPRRITNDLLYYRELGVSADGTKLVADVADAEVHIWRKTIEGGDAAVRVSGGHLDGVAGISTMSDGRLVFTSIERGTTTLWSMDRDGNGRRQLIRNPYREEYPSAFSGGVAYVSTTPAATELCLISNEGEGRRVVVSGIDDAPIAASPDGTSFVYAVDRRLWTTSADGRERRQLTQEVASAPAWSPKADRIAYIAGDSERVRLVVVHADGSPVWSSGILPGAGAHWLRWDRDGRGLLLAYWSGGVWLYAFSGRPRRLTDAGTIWSFDVSPAGELFVSRGYVSRDSVLITGFR